jgi:hypothetical protein
MMGRDEDWVEARTGDLLSDLEQSYGRRFDQDRARDLVRAFLVVRGDTELPWSEEDRDALASGAAMALLGTEYRPPSPTSTYAAPVDLAVAFNALLGLGLAAAHWQRQNPDVPDAEYLRELLASLVEWLFPISETCLDLATAAKPAARSHDKDAEEGAGRADAVVVGEGDEADLVVIEARQAFRSSELLARAAAHLERDYLDQAEQAAWTSSAAMCACLSTSADDLRRATGAE